MRFISVGDAVLVSQSFKSSPFVPKDTGVKLGTGGKAPPPVLPPLVLPLPEPVPPPALLRQALNSSAAISATVVSAAAPLKAKAFAFLLLFESIIDLHKNCFVLRGFPLKNPTD